MHYIIAFLIITVSIVFLSYGARATSEECPHAIIVMCLQSIIGVYDGRIWFYQNLDRERRRKCNLTSRTNHVQVDKIMESP